MTTLDEYVDSFELLEDWDQRYEYLIELGEQLDELPESDKTEDNRVKACLSRVWIVASLEDGRIRLHGDCDNSITKGILAVLINICDGMTAQQIIDTDMDNIFHQLHLYDHLSPNRHVGVYAMFEKLKEKAREADGK